jgi:hypothetical protein
MSSLPQCLLIVTAEVDAKIEAEWNRWYDDNHLPAALACPGVLSGKRYMASGPIFDNNRGQRSERNTRVYTTVYELSDPDAVNTPQFLAMRGWHHLSPGVRSETKVVVAVPTRTTL